MISDLRFSGLASGMDTESIVKKLMDAERLPLNKMMQKKQIQEWQRDAYREANTMLLGLRTSMEKLRLQSTFTQSKVSSTDTAKVDVSRVGIPSMSSYTISEVNFAEAAQPASVKFTMDSSLDAETDVVGQTFDFTVNGKTVNVVSTDTVKGVVDKINSISTDSGVKATYFQGDNSITFTTTEAKENVILQITGSTSNLLNIANGEINGTTITGFGSNAVAGKDVTQGSVKINGMVHTITSNTFTFDGMKFTLKSELTGTETVTINKETDTDAIFNDIKTFVDKYNEVIQTLNDKIDEKKYRNFAPLLDEQKEAMKDKEIELWEVKAKSGLLRNDSMISEVLVKMRNSLTDLVSGAGDSKFDTLSEIGIKTSDNYKDNGKLVIDETKLKEAINSNLENVKTFFTKTYDTGNTSDTTATNTDKYNQSGIGWRLYDQLNASMKEITNKAGSISTVETSSILGKSIDKIDDQIDAFQARLTQIENRYWRQFTEMEKAISKANSQSGWLSQQFSAGM